MDRRKDWAEDVTRRWDDSDEFNSDDLDGDDLTRIISHQKDKKPIANELTTQPDEKYDVLHQIDQGGMKTILEVEDRDTMRHMAMAVLTNDDDGSNVYRFIQEARITANLEHPNIMPIHDIGVDSEGVPYFTMKRVKGETLTNIIKKLKNGQAHYRRKYDLPHLLQIFQKVCDAVSYAHSKDIIHLDLKPSNILVGGYGEVIVLDWGLAKFVGSEDASDAEENDEDLEPVSRDDSRVRMKSFSHEEHKTVDGEIKGTPGYMAPEQAAGLNEDKDFRTDIYALGAILYYILTWEPPIVGKNLEKVFTDTISGNVPPPRKRSPERFIPEALEAITLKAMSIHPMDRYPHVKKLIKDLDKFSGGFATSAEEASWFKQLRLLVKRRKLESILVLVIFVSVLSITSIWLTDKMKRKATWGIGEDITPGSDTEFASDWIVTTGKWRREGNAIVAVPGKGDSFRIYYNRPVYGNIALEFDGLIKSAEDLGKSGDLSVIFSGNPKTQAGYYLQVGGVGNTSAMIQRKGGIVSSVNFSLQPGRTYHIRAEKEGAWLRLYCDGELLLETRDIFYLEGGYVGLYTFGKGKEFSNIRLFHRGVPELVPPIFEGDSYYRQSRVNDGELRRKFLLLAKGAYNRVFNSHPKKELGYQALLKKAYIDIELGNLSEAQFDCGYLENHYQNLEQLMLKAELAFCEQKYDDALDICGEAIQEYPKSKNGTIGYLTGKLTQKTADAMNPELLMQFWKLCALNQGTPILRCRQKGLTSLDFLKGMDFELIDCSENRIQSLKALKGMKTLQKLDCADNQIRDLSPLKGMELIHLECYNNPITSIDVLKGMPLKSLALNGCEKLTDISILKECKSLERLTIPKQIKEIEFLKQLPNLKYLSYEWDAWTKTADEFWKEYEEDTK